jgi:hypothetical protein
MNAIDPSRLVEALQVDPVLAPRVFAYVERDPAPVLILDELMDRVVAEVERELGASAPHPRVVRANLLAMLRKLDEAELGRFVEGRRGKKTRLEWLVSASAVARAAASPPESAPPRALAPRGDEDEDEDDEHEPLGVVAFIEQARSRAAEAPEDPAPALPLPLAPREPAERAPAEKTMAGPVPRAPARLRHRFVLRPDVTVELELPEDLSAREARRLALFVKSLPFA